MIELGGITRVVGSITRIAPVVSRSGDLQFGLFNTRIKCDRAGRDGARVRVIAKGVISIPKLLHIYIGIFRRAFGIFKDGSGVVAFTRCILFAVIFKFDKALQHGGEVGHIEVVHAFHAEGGDVTTQFHPFATVVFHTNIALVVVSVAVAVHAVMQIM